MINNDKPAVLIIDDDVIFRTRLSRAFEHRGWEVHGAGDLNSALGAASEISPDLVIIDLRMPGESGIEVVRRLRDLDSTVSIIMLTGYGSIATALEAIMSGANHYLTKPVDVDQILATYENIRSSPSSDTPSPETVPSLARVEWEHIQRILTDCGGNITQTAKLLGIHRRSLQRKLSKRPPQT
ncbi:MAG TPA: response regulator [Acidobacteriota bacterium]|nr:response regulator [Acidobacteriota bacterium]